MKTINRYKRIIALMLAFVMIVQSSVSSVSANTISTEATKNTAAVSTVEDTNGTETTTGTKSTDATSATTAQTNSNIEFNSKITQSIYKKDGKNFVKYTVLMRNLNTAAAGTTNVKVLLPETMSYVDDKLNTTPGLKVFKNQTVLEEGYNLNEFDRITLAKYKNAQVMIWKDLRFKAGEERELTVIAEVTSPVQNVYQLDSVWSINGQTVKGVWENVQDLILAPATTAANKTTETQTAATTEAEEEEKKEEQKNPVVRFFSGLARSVANVLNVDGDGEGEAEVTSNQLTDFLTNAHLLSHDTVTDADGNKVNIEYDTTNPAYNNGWFYLKLDFGESDRYQFPVYDENNAENTTITYEIPAGIKGIDDIEGASIKDPETKLEYGTYDVYSVKQEDATPNDPTDDVYKYYINIKFNNNVKQFTNCSAFITLDAQFNRTVIQGGTNHEFEFGGNVNVTAKFEEGGKISANKTASTYDPEKGTFTFTITMVAEENLTNVIIEDEMGENLVFKPDSVKLNGNSLNNAVQTSKGFNLTINQLKQGTHTLTYEASIKNSALWEYNGVEMPGLTNEATLKADGVTEFDVDGDAEYTHKWLEKENSGVSAETGKVQWEVTLNPNADQDVSGIKIKDSLPASGINYDRTQPITVSPSINGSSTISWDDVIAEDGKSWTFTMPNNLPDNQKKSTYTFTYFTTVESGITGSFSNKVTANGKFPTTSTVTIGEGTGTGTGFGTVQKTVGDIINTDAGDKYIPWTSTLHLNAGEHVNVIYRDQLYGEQSFGNLTLQTAENQYDKITINLNGISLADGKPTLEYDNDSFTISFGNISLSQATDIVITYYSEADMNGTMNNIGDLESNGKVTSDSEGTTVMDANFSKVGSYDANTGIITWNIKLNDDGKQFVANYVHIQDTLPEQLELIKGINQSLMTMYVDNEVVGYLYGDYNTTTNVINANYNSLNTTKEVHVEYQTKLKDGVSRNEALELENNALIDINNKTVNVNDEVIIPSNIIDKSIIENPTKENGYIGQFEVVINESGVNFGKTDSTVTDYVIEDVLSSTIELQTASVKVYQKVGHGWVELSATESQTETYYVAAYDDATSKLTISIKQPELTDNRTYKLTYNGIVRPGTGTGSVHWDNTATFKAGKTVKDDYVDGWVEKEQSTDSGITGSLLYVNVFKHESLVISAVLGGAEFALYELNSDTDTYENKSPVATVTTGSDGKGHLGQSQGPNGAEGYPFKENQRYVLVETKAPAGYIAGDPIYFQIGDKISSDKFVSYNIADTLDVGNIPTTDISVEKTWDDNYNQDGIRPASVSVQLYRKAGNGTEESVGDAVTLNESNSWKKTWSKLPAIVIQNGEKVTYTYRVDEVTVPTGYTKNVTSNDAKTSYVIKNTHKPDETSKSVEKVWDDDSNRDGLRPTSIQVQLLSNGSVYGESVTLNAANDWTYTWNNLPKKSNGVDIVYTVKEDVSDSNYETSYSTDKDTGKVTITNKHVPEKVSFEVKKQWNDKGDADNNRPESIVVALYAGSDTNKVGEKTLTATNNWTAKWEKLPKKANGSNINYYAKEITIVPGYTPDDADPVVSDNAITQTITNNYEKGYTEKTVTKVWQDANNQDGKRPKSISVTLYQNWKENGNDYKEKYNVADNPVTLNAENNWTYTWKNLPARENGHDFTYTVEESDVPAGYTSTQSTTGTTTTITNSITTELTSKKVTKVWNDNSNEDGNRPTSIQVELYANREKYVASGVRNPVTLDAANGWTYNWENLPKYSEGTAINYTVKEIGTYKGYITSQSTNNPDGDVTITNNYTRETTDLSIEKEWIDNENRANARPTSVTVKLYKKIGNGAETVIDTVTLDSSNNWRKTWTSLITREDHADVTYRAEEQNVADRYTVSYDSTTKEKTIIIKNTYDEEKTSFTAKKIWDDNNNQDGKRWNSVKLQLKADGVAQGEPVTVTGSVTNPEWEYTWTGLQKYRDGEVGQLIVYTVEEVQIPTEGNEYNSPTYNQTKDTVTNSYTPKETQISVTKVWQDANNQDGKRPASLVVTLKKNGTDYKTATLTADNNWKALWTGLPVYENQNKITYTVVEAPVAGYILSGDTGLELNQDTGIYEVTLTNSYETEKTSKTVIKKWNDEENRDGIRPEGINVRLYERRYTGRNDSQSGEKVYETVISKVTDNTVTLNKANYWSYSWTNLDKMYKGEEITYIVDEVATPDGYGKVVNGFEITNTYGPAKTSRTVKKVWDDANDQDGIRPDTVKVTLWAKEGTAEKYKVSDVTLKKEDNYSYTWNDLKVYTAAGDDGDAKIEYSLTEEQVDGYEVPQIVFAEKDKDDKVINTFTVTNKRTPDVTSKSVVKVWDDDSNRDGIRQKFIEVELVATTGSGDDIDTVDLVNKYNIKDTVVTLTVDNDTDNNKNTWEYTWENLPVKDNGKAITYKVEEISEITGYTTTYDTNDNGFVITNKHTTDVLQRTLVKYWKDNNDMTNRPDKVIFQLMKSEYDGSGEVTDDANWTAKEKVGEPVEFAGSSSTWTYTWSNLTKKANGQDIRYSVEEKNIPAGYEVLYDGDDFIFTATNVKTNIEISKTSLTDGAPIKGATLEIRDMEGNIVVDPWESETTAKLVSGVLKVGETYKLVETEAPAGHTIAEPVEFTVNSDGKIQKVSMVDEPTVVKIKKTDLTGEKEIAGATLQIVDSKGKVVEEWTSALEAHIITAKLNIGETYTLKETAAPLGYAYTTDIKFMLNNKGKVVKVEGETADVPMTEDGTILVKDTPLELRVNKVELTGEKEIAGAVLELYAADDVNEDGTIKEGAKSIGQWMSEVGTTHDFGSVIQAGKSYVLVETVPADGYGYASNIHFEVKDDGKIVTTAKQTKDKDDNVVYLMEDDFTRVSITKTDITGEKILEGAVLQIFDKEGKAVTESWTSEEKATLIEGTLKAGHEYILRELKAPAGYALANDVTFKVNNDGTIKEVSMKDSMTKVEITKKDITTGEELPGATLQVIDSEGDVIDEWISTEEAHVIEGVLVAGATYTLREVLSPDGYAVAKDVEFVVTDKVDKDGNVVVDSVVMEDSFTEVSIKKTDITGKNELVGAELQLVDKDGNEIDKWTSEETAHVITGKLIVGETYTLKELTPPEGYAFAADVTFEIGADGKAIVAEESKAADGTILMKDTKTEVTVTKVDEENKPLVGAILAIKDMETGKIIEQWTTTEEPYKVSGKVVVGKEYYLTELMVPEGYQFAGDITFKVPEDGIVVLSMVDTKLENNKGTIKVVKKLAALDGLDFVDLITEEGVFYVGLFTDEAGKHPFGTDNVKEIKITKDSVSEPVVYENLPAGTYYVIETDKDGNPLKLDEQHKDAAGNTFVCIVDVGATNKVEIDLDTAKTAGTVELTNVFYDLPDGFSYSASIDITKEVLKDEKPVNVDDTFYAGIFTKEADGTYKLYQEVTLKQNDKVTVKVPLGGENGDQPITYYVFETDGKGAMVDKTAFVYDVSGEGEVSVSKTALTGAITITNIVPDDVFELEILKVNEEDETLKGATFVLETQDGTEVATWKSGKFARVLNLTAGTYILTETKAPKGYVIGEDIKIVIDKDGTITVEGENATLEDNVVSYINEAEEVEEDEEDDEDGGSKKSTSTKTGDRTNMEIYMLLMAAAVITALAVARRKREEDL